MLALAASLHAQTYSVLHNFGGGTSGSYPYYGLTMDRAGNFYGTTYEGGSNGQGMVFKLAKHNGSWIFSSIYSFRGGNDEAFPYAGINDRARRRPRRHHLQRRPWRPACAGGCGTVYKVTPPANVCQHTSCPWNETVLYNFYDAGLQLSHPGWRHLRFPWQHVRYDLLRRYRPVS